MAESARDADHLVARLADRDRIRSEATVQADTRQLLLSGGFGLGQHDLDALAEQQLTGYVHPA